MSDTGAHQFAPSTVPRPSISSGLGRRASIAASVRSHTSPSTRNLRDNESLIGGNYESEEAEEEEQGLAMFTYNFWAPELAQLRKSYLIPVALTTLLMCIAVWLFFSLYWASLYKVNERAPNVDGWIINRDNNIIGNAIENALLESTRSGKALTWKVRDPKLNPDVRSIRDAVDPGYKTWVVIEIKEGVSESLKRAQRNADSSWDPSSVMSMYYSDSRSYQAYPGTIVQPTLKTVNNAALNVSRSIAQELARSDASALANALNTAPHTIIGSVSLNPINMRPWNNPVAIAPTFVGMIYLLILAFQVTMASFMSRQGIKTHLKFWSYLCMRFCTPAVAYIFISLMITLLNVAFELPYGAALPYGGGFMTWWCLSYTGMLVCGLTLESIITVIGPKFIGIFLIFFIISNVSVSNYPPALMNRFFQYGYAMPFYNMRQVFTTILFNTGSHVEILKYFGILWAWIALIMLTMPIFIWLDYNRVRKSRLHGDGTAKSH